MVKSVVHHSENVVHPKKNRLPRLHCTDWFYFGTKDESCTGEADLLTFFQPQYHPGMQPPQVWAKVTTINPAETLVMKEVQEVEVVVMMEAVVNSDDALSFYDLVVMNN